MRTHISRPNLDRSTSDRDRIESNRISEGQQASDIDDEPLQPPAPQPVASSQLRLQHYESELQREFEIYQRMEQRLAILRQWITFGREQAFRRREATQLQSSIQGIMTLSRAPPVVVEVQPIP
jgi:hypothetical protein